MTGAAKVRDGCTIRTVTVLAARGEMDLSTEGGSLVTAATEALEEADGHPVVIDLPALTFMSSSGLGHIVALETMARSTGTPLRIVVGDAWAVFRPFAVPGLGETSSIFRTVDDAVAGRGGRPPTAEPLPRVSDMAWRDPPAAPARRLRRRIIVYDGRRSRCGGLRAILDVHPRRTPARRVVMQPTSRSTEGLTFARGGGPGRFAPAPGPVRVPPPGGRSR